MCRENGYILGCDTLFRPVYEEDVGGKASNLFYLKRHGFSVPPWVVVTSGLFRAVTAPRQQSIKALLREFDPNDPHATRVVSSRIGRMITELELPQNFVRKMSTRVCSAFGNGKSVSVRSSVVGEDSGEHSFAGQMDSFLNVRQADVATAIKKVWASAYSPRALTYRHSKRISLEDISVAVIIQEMIESVSSGVLFTRDPENRERLCVVSAAYGLGEGVVQDRVGSDTYRVAWRSSEITADVADKERQIVCDAGRNGICERLVDQSRRTRPVLTDKQILKLVKLGRKSERWFGRPQDIEWAIDAGGRLHILQARPIVFGNNGHRPHTTIWDNSNIVESYPGLTLPLTFSFIKRCYRISFQRAAEGFLLSNESLDKDRHIFENMIGLLDGRVYYNLLNWYRMLSYLPGFSRHRKSWDKMIGIAQKTPFPQTRLSLVGRAVSVMIVVARLLSVRYNSRVFFRHFSREYQQFNSQDISTTDEFGLIERFRSLERAFTPEWHRTLYNDFCAMKYYDWLKSLCSKWGLEIHRNLHNDLLCGEKGVESVAPLHSLLELAELISSRPRYRRLLDNVDNETVWEEIQSSPDLVQVRNRLAAHLEAYGDRGLEELKLERPTFREKPEPLIELLRNYVRLGSTVNDLRAQETAVREQAEKLVACTLRNPFRRALFSFVLRNARRSVAARENMRFARSRLFGLVRPLFRHMGEIFADRELLSTPDDVFYLTVDEVFGFVEGTATTRDLKALVRLRRQEFAAFGNRFPADRITVEGIPYCQSLMSSPVRSAAGSILKGIGCSSGISKAPARVVLDPNTSLPDGDYILVARSTDPGWIFLMIQSRGIVVEKGSVLSHTAIIGRELGIPTVVAVSFATTAIKDGQPITINGSTGEIQCR